MVGPTEDGVLAGGAESRLTSKRNEDLGRRVVEMLVQVIRVG